MISLIQRSIVPAAAVLSLLGAAYADDASTRLSIIQQLTTEQKRGLNDQNLDYLVDSADLVYSGKGETLYRVNAGGPAFTDELGNNWSADAGFFNFGTVGNNGRPAEGTPHNTLFQTERWKPNTDSARMQYNFDVAPGLYLVRLHLIDFTYVNAGQRVFDVTVEGDAKLDNVDIAGTAGWNRAMVRELTQSVYDGKLSVQFIPQTENPSIAGIEVIKLPSFIPDYPSLYRINCGGSTFLDPWGRTWSADSFFVPASSAVYTAPGSVNGTAFGAMMLTERYTTGNLLEYNFPVQAGLYSVQLHFSENFHTAVDSRAIRIDLEGQTCQSYYDTLFRTTPYNSNTVTCEAVVTDGNLDLDFIKVKGDVKINAIEIRRIGGLDVTAEPILLPYRTVSVGSTPQTQVVGLRNSGTLPARIQRLRFENRRGNSNLFTVFLNGIGYGGSSGSKTHDHQKIQPKNVSHNIDVTIAPRETLLVPIEFDPRESTDSYVDAIFEGSFAPARVTLSAITATDGHVEGSLLHVVVDGPDFFTDFDGDGQATVRILGENSHTHQIGGRVESYLWTDSSNGGTLSESVNLTRNFPVGTHTVELTIFSSTDELGQLSANKQFEVVPADRIPGILTQYFDFSAGGSVINLDVLPFGANYAEVLSAFFVGNQSGRIGASPFTRDTIVQFKGFYEFSEPGSYTFESSGGSETRLFIDGQQVNGAMDLTAGRKAIDFRFAVNALDQLPLGITYRINGGSNQVFPTDSVQHTQIGLTPVMNTITPSGNPSGGDPIQITGVGFYPEDILTVSWGGATLPNSLLTVTDTSVNFSSPPGQGAVFVTVNTNHGVSNALLFQYDDSAPVPVKFTKRKVADLVAGTKGAWGPDGRFYVTSVMGTITALTFDEDYNVVNTQVITALQGTSNNNILGVAFNPFDPPEPVRLYVSHNQLFANGGGCFSGFSPYSGQVSRLEGPNFNTFTPVITGLPVSNHDHGVNDLEFDNNGDLFITVGSNTNAGVADCSIGGLAESPFSAAILKAQLSKPNFNGEILYYNGSGQLSMNQAAGGTANVGAGIDISVWAPGVRNDYDIVYTTDERIYGVDNGADPPYGPVSTGPNSQGGLPNDPEELYRYFENAYYGHPNRNRGRFDNRQNVYYASGQSGGGVAVTKLDTFGYSTNGMTEYRANNFSGSMRGELIAQIWNSNTFRIKLSADGNSVQQKNLLPVSLNSLSIATGPAGFIVGVDYTNNQIVVADPTDPPVSAVTIYDIFPWRGPTTGGTSFVLSGQNFGTLQNTSVLIGGIPATITSVTGRRIKGFIPARPNAPEGMLTVTVQVGSNVGFISNAFRYIGPRAADTGARATVEIEPFQNIVESSTYYPNSFKVNNTSTNGQKITKVVYDLRTCLLPDLVFDPFANAGDPVGKNFTLDSNNTGGSVNAAFSELHDGGYDVLTINFGNFGPGKGIGFSVDCDPTTINGAPAPGPRHSGSISGFELQGASIRIEFNDGTVLITQPWRKAGSGTGSKNTASPSLPTPPGIEIVGQGGRQVNVSNANQVIRVTGVPGSTIQFIHCEVALFTAGTPGGGFDIDPFEANTVLNIDETSHVIPASASLDIPVTLRKSESLGGFNYICAVVKAPDGSTGQISPVAVLKLD
jgi:hypothetical protein